MYQFTVPMALVDFLPVLLFGWAAVVLLQDLYAKMGKCSYALFACGTINIFAAGFLKALWKLLYAAGICDFQVLYDLFLPMQSVGFLLAGIGMLLLLVKKKAVLSVAPPVFASSVPFLCIMTLGLGAICVCLSILAAKMRKPLAAVIFIASFLTSMGMAALAGQDLTLPWVNWTEQAINCAGQGLLLAGTLILHRADLKNFQLK